jgi:hypothetical protein
MIDWRSMLIMCYSLSGPMKPQLQTSRSVRHGPEQDLDIKREIMQSTGKTCPFFVCNFHCGSGTWSDSLQKEICLKIVGRQGQIRVGPSTLSTIRRLFAMFDGKILQVQMRWNLCWKVSCCNPEVSRYSHLREV